MRGIVPALFLLAVAARAVEPSPEAKPLLILPDADGVLDLAGALQARNFDAIPNPFRVRSHLPAPIREISLAITAVLIPGGREEACAVVNGQLLSPGDTIEGLKLARIGAESLELLGDGLVLRVPVQDRPPKLRLSSP